MEHYFKMNEVAGELNYYDEQFNFFDSNNEMLTCDRLFEEGKNEDDFPWNIKDFKKMGYGFFTNAQTDKQGSLTGSGYVFVSAFPIVRHAVAGQGEKNVNGVWADVKVGRDTVRIFNNHLHSMNITVSDSEDIAEGRILQDGDRMRSIVNRIADNSSIRASYVDTLCMVVAETPYENIICGDFNDDAFNDLQAFFIEFL